MKTKDKLPASKSNTRVKKGKSTTSQSIKWIIRSLLLLGIFWAGCSYIFFFVQRAFLLPITSINQDEVKLLIEIPKNSAFKNVAKNLEQKGLLRHWWTLYLLARLTGKDRTLSAGEFEISSTMNVPDMLNRLINGPAFRRRVLIREGTRVDELPPLFEMAGIISAIELRKALSDKNLQLDLGIPAEAPSFEGYLFPDTYFFSRPIEGKEILKRLILEGKRKWNSEWELARQSKRLSLHEVLTLASIIEKESGNFHEQPLIASVFYNRLSSGMKLQSDPTVIYGIPNFNGNLTRFDLTNPSPYNTYIINGLPPGPISNPGISAIKAALFPQPSNYLYFVADGTGKHIFSKTLAEHNQAVNLYQRNNS